MTRKRLFPLLLAPILACVDRPTSSTPPTPRSTPSDPASASTSAPASVDPSAPFVRHPPSSHNSDADAVDECTQHGGNYFSCRLAHDAEKVPVIKRYLYRIAQGQAAGESGYAHTGPREEPGSLPHAEVPGMCDPKKPCNAKNESVELNDAMSCLARVHSAVVSGDPADAKASHAHACKCDAQGGAMPGYNWTPYICDKNGKPAFIAPAMSKAEGKDIVMCANCDPKEGPRACKAEIARLEKGDAELANYIATEQIRRCQTPNTGPNEWPW